MGTTAEKLTYLNETKTQLKDMLNLGGASLTTEPFRQYVDTLKNRYLYFMNNGTQQVWDNWDKVNGTGKTLTLNNTEEAPMSLVYKGNTSQNGTPTPDSPIPIQVVSGDNSIEVVGYNRLNMQTIVKGRLDYGVIGYASDTSNLTLNEESLSFTTTANYRGVVTDYIPIDYSGIFIVFSYESSTTAVGCSIAFYDENKNFIRQTSGARITNGNRFGNDATAKYARLWISLDSAGTVTITKPQIEITSSPTQSDYVKYTGESYPISLGVENLINAPDITLSGVGYVFNLSNLTIPAGTYTLDIKCPYTSLNMACIDKDGTEYFNSNKNLPVTIEATNGIKTLRVYNANSAGGTFTDIQLTEGSTPQRVSTNPIQLLHIPNTNYYDKIDKSTGKNLFDKDNALHYSTDGSGNTTTTNYYNSTDYITCNSGDSFTISGIPATTSDYNFKVVFFDSNKNYISRPIAQAGTVNTRSSFSTTAPTNAKYVMAQFYNNLKEGQFEKGSVATEYEPYGTGWYVKKEIGKVVLNGSENWNKRTATGNSYGGMYIQDCSAVWGTKTSYTNYFTYNVENAYNGTANGYGIDGNGQVMIGYPNMTSLADFKTWLSSNNVEVRYVLKTPTYTLIEDSTLISQLEALKSKTGQTNISQTNNDMPFILDITALSKE